MSSTYKFLTAVAAASVLAFTAQAKITYVDATDGVGGNTAVAGSAGGGIFTPVDPQGPAGDGLWDVRAFANNGTIYQNAGYGNTDNAQRLQTSVVGLDLNSFNVYVYFWSDTSLSWRIGASLSDEAGDLPLFDPSTAGVVSFYSGADATVYSGSLADNPFTTDDVMVAEGNRRLYQAPLDVIYSSAFTVYIDDDPNQADGNQRTWYDGVGYEVTIVPEPTSAALLGLGVLVGLFAMRRKA